MVNEFVATLGTCSKTFSETSFFKVIRKCSHYELEMHPCKINIKKICLTSWVYSSKVSFSRLNVNLQTREGVKSTFVKGGKFSSTSFLQGQNARFGHVRNTRANSESKPQAAYTDLKVMSLAWPNALLENCFCSLFCPLAVACRF